MKSSETMSAEVEFNSLHFEKKLSNLKDSQESINAACTWCLEHKQYHKKIVATWLSVLKRVKVEQRLTLFYLANDVIQYSKRRNYDFVESWGTALQKATTLVRDAKVKHKILRIFKIWEQRGVYGEEFISDLSGLISVSPSTKKIDESHEFQSAHLVGKIRTCAKLESETDRKLQLFKQHNPKLQDGEALMSSLKDRATVDDVEKEMDDYINHMESYIEALRTEIKARNSLINLLQTADTQLEKDRKDVKVVAVAYKSFAVRVKNLKKKLEEKKATLNSPVPSPDVNAPSPSPDSDLELPENDAVSAPLPPPAVTTASVTYPTAGFYNQIALAPLAGSDSFMNMNNGFSSFIGTGMTFTLNAHAQKTALTTLFPALADPPPPPAPVPVPPPQQQYDYSGHGGQMPLAPPPLPPFTSDAYGDYANSTSYGSQYPEDPYNNAYNNNAYHGETPRAGAVYNPEEEVENWSQGGEWDHSQHQPPLPLPTASETPTSPPAIEKESFLAPIEYHEGQSIPGAHDVDHRIMLGHGMNNNSDKQDIDHRNLISLTGSPKEVISERPPLLKEPPHDWQPDVHTFPAHPRRHKDFRHNSSDNNESIDMELSDDDAVGGNGGNQQMVADHEIVMKTGGLLPPPPFPADMDANMFQEPPPYCDGVDGPAWRRPPPPPPHMRGPPPAMGRRGGMRMQHHPMPGGGRGEFNNRGDFRGRFRGAPPPLGGGNKYGRGGWPGPPPMPMGPRGPMRGRGGRGYGHFHKNY